MYSVIPRLLVLLGSPFTSSTNASMRIRQAASGRGYWAGRSMPGSTVLAASVGCGLRPRVCRMELPCSVLKGFLDLRSPPGCQRNCQETRERPCDGAAGRSHDRYGEECGRQRVVHGVFGSDLRAEGACSR